MYSNIKVKNRKKSPCDNRITLDAQHNEKMKYFNDLQKSLPNKKKLLKQYEKEYQELIDIKLENLDNTQIEKYIEYKKNIPILKQEIEDIENKKLENEYLLNTGDLLFEYYNHIENADTISKKKKNVKKKKNIKVDESNKTVLDFFQMKTNNSNHNLNETKEIEHVDEIIPDNQYSNLSKGKMLDKYLDITDDSYISNDNCLEYNNEFCQNCLLDNMIILHNKGVIVCENCGYQSYILIDSEKPSYKDPPKEISYFAYKRINHFNEWLAQFQAKETTDIPDNVYDAILLEIKKERITDMRQLNQLKVREILKKLKLNKYYEHVPHIINRLNGIPPPVMSRETEEKLRMMFKEIQTPFAKYCPKKVRKNFLSYSYVLHKFVQLLGLDEFLSCFPLLKSREKLHQQDKIWEKICEDLKWEFIKSL